MKDSTAKPLPDQQGSALMIGPGTVFVLLWHPFFLPMSHEKDENVQKYFEHELWL